MVGADETDFDWEGYRDALAAEYDPTEADVSVEIIQRYTDGTEPLTRPELDLIHEEIIAHPDTPEFSDDLVAVRSDHQDAVTQAHPGAAQHTVREPARTLVDSLNLVANDCTTTSWDDSNAASRVAGVPYAEVSDGTDGHEIFAEVELAGVAEAEASVDHTESSLTPPVAIESASLIRGQPSKRHRR